MPINTALKYCNPQLLADKIIFLQNLILYSYVCSFTEQIFVIN